MALVAFKGQKRPIFCLSPANNCLRRGEAELRVYQPPSGLRLGTPELTRLGMGVDEMQDVARFFSRALLDREDPSSVKSDVREFKSEFQNVHYCFEPGPAYPGLE